MCVCVCVCVVVVVVVVVHICSSTSITLSSCLKRELIQHYCSYAQLPTESPRPLPARKRATETTKILDEHFYKAKYCTECNQDAPRIFTE